jgi:hypothetical protein
MEQLFENYYNYYYFVLGLQGFCVYHSFKRGTQSKWLWIIVFLPLIGSLIYLFSEVIKKRHIDNVQSGVATLVNPSGRIKDLEKKFQFTNTFANRVALADAYFDSRMYDKAIEMYEPALTGLYADNEHVIRNLIQCYYQFERFEDILRIAPRVASSTEFSRSPANLYYAYALEKAGKLTEAEKEYKRMDHRFSNYEARCAYGDFLLRCDRPKDAALVFNEVVEESERMERREKAGNKVWFERAQRELSKIMSASGSI